MTTHGAALQDAVAHATEVLTAPVAGLVPGRLSTSEWMMMVRDVERLGRLVDAARVALAGDAEQRTGGPVDALAALRFASAVDAVATLTGLADRDAKRRIRLGATLNAGLSLTGAETRSVYPSVARAVSAGNLGVDAATILTDALEGVSPRIDPVVIAEAEEALVHLAEGSPDHPPLRADLVRGQAHLFVEAIDPDGVRPREEVARRKRRFTIGPDTHDGLIPVHGLLTLEIGAGLKRLIDAHVRKVTFTDGPRQLDDTTRPVEAAESVESVESVDDRTPAQRRHDTLADIVSAASRVKDAPELAGAAPAIIVTVTQTVLDSGRGVGSIDGVDTPISVDAIEKMTDSRGIQTVTMNPDRRILSLGSVQRCFTSSQRRAITARDGGCVIPGCTTPAGWCEVHHVIPWRAGGETHTDNGVLLCWGHHQNIDRGPWRLTMSDGIPHVRGPGHPDRTHTTKTRTGPPLTRTG
ncbi:HNH endonuclease [Labedella gwakjiensis]|uniref:HNH endonuclease n=1 Tax=Labedella gwakjiensis TaxID=390269 RepID=A0A2P8H0H4_9MICO|nr:HNH endonuclease signature motif containing protein [Labedella gwakjiensis]PSL39688.1 HNH endonuclease [Labedella gwakjiensis]RUQ85926.1 HNH endonuclease [Labedella gwakjiensis]